MTPAKSYRDRLDAWAGFPIGGDAPAAPVAAPTAVTLSIADAHKVRVVRQLIEAIGMDTGISFAEHQAWMRVLSTASDASLLRLRAGLR